MERPWQTEFLTHGIRVLVGGSGTPVFLLPGWPKRAEAYSDVFEALSEHHRTFSIDPPGLGDSVSSTSGYDTGTISRILEESLWSAENPV